MLGVDPEISLHKLHLDSSYKPVKQKKRNFSEEKNLAIEEVILLEGHAFWAKKCWSCLLEDGQRHLLGLDR
ncbi:hypothetical protein LIER_06339 [Lithospermum erythrorhizon]|uniref:Uncharacterized protein n=1 Tax=Lithospermum erythrorhizon TaxID=34254 RepID=A0AAV3P6M3_LITER